MAHFGVLKEMRISKSSVMISESKLPVPTRNTVESSWHRCPAGTYTQDFVLSTVEDTPRFLAQVAECAIDRQCPYVTVSLDGKSIRIQIGDTSKAITGIEADVARDISEVYADMQHTYSISDGDYGY